MKKILLLTCLILLLLPWSTRSDDFYNENLVIIMDCSGSMEGSKIEQAKLALKEILNYVPNNTHIGLLSFGGSKSDWKYDLGPRNDDQLIHAIDMLNTGGTTPLGEYMKYGAERLLKQKEKQLGYGNYRLLVITDGEASDQALVDRYTPDIMAKGVTIDLIGVYMNSQHSLSKMVHSYREANDTASLKQAITEVLAEIGGRQDDTATTDAFDTVSGIPQEMAISIIAAISNTPDQPIGEGKEAMETRTQTKTGSSPAQQSNSSGSSAPQWIFVLIVFITIVSRIISKKRK